ncbi:MAG: type IX secretion system membrane protein PorP/SprF [Marinilabiliaceae bacterium]|nr:type IX secretion system membrane protein PorP/SprF [Marinilabiliaceae bacterium]
MMKRISILVIGFMMYTAVWSQKYYITNQYVYDLFLVNPAAAGIQKDCYQVNGSYQKQWFGIEEAPTTQIISVQGPVTSNLGLGMYAFNDRNGYYGEMGFQMALSYEVQLLNKQNTVSSLTFGLAFSGEQSVLDGTMFSDETLLDPAISGGRDSGWGMNASSGFLWKHNHYQLGVVVTNLLPQVNTLYLNEGEPERVMDFHFHLGTTYKLSDREIYLSPLLMYRRNAAADSRLDFNLKSHFPTANPHVSLWGVAAYRRNMDHQFGKSIGAAMTAGIQYKQFSMGLEYQLGLTSVRKEYGNAYQLVFGYRFCKSQTKKSIPCSEIHFKKRKSASRIVKKMIAEEMN